MVKEPKKRITEHVESKRLIESAFELARTLNIGKMLVQADELRDIRIIDDLRGEEEIIWLWRADADVPDKKPRSDKIVIIPDTTLTRMSQLKIGLLLAVLNDYVEPDESALCLSGVAGSGRLDTLLITNPQRDFPWFQRTDAEAAQRAIATHEFLRLLDISLRFAREGREGKPLGTIFVLGDPEELKPHLRQLVLNPCEGHPQKNRNINDEEFVETLREFAALDGAFVVAPRGVVESAGTYLDAPVRKAKVRPGLGARHTAAAAVTGETGAIAIVVSESSGTVTVFHDGQAILELENPQPRRQDGQKK